MNLIWISFILFAVWTPHTDGSHFRGAMIYWKQSSIDKAVIDLDYRQAWRRSSINPYCNESVKEDGILLTDGELLSIESSMYASYGNPGYNGVPFEFQCTDYSIIEDWTSGKGRANFTPSALDNTTNVFYVKYSGCCWIGTILDMNSDRWSFVALINTTTRADTGKMNESPRVDMAPIQRLQYGCNHTIKIPVTDADGDHIRCRWSGYNSMYDECGGACHTFRNATIDEEACTITYGAFYSLGWYAVAVQVEDFRSKTSKSVLSSIPLQFLVSVENKTESCETYKKEKPKFIGLTLPDKACIGVKDNTDFTADIYIDSKNSSISELNTVSPIGLVKSSLQQVNASGTWHISVKWNPNNTDTVNNVFCFTAVDNHGLSSEQRCLTLLAGVPPAVILQSSRTPVGSPVLRSQHQWSIEFDQFANPATRSAYIYLYLANGTLVETINVYNDSGVSFTNGSHGTVLSYHTSTALQGGQEYYFLFGQGLIQGLSYCGAESSSVLDPSFWRFTVEPSPDKNVHVECKRQSTVVPCDEKDLNCTETWSLTNPCTKENALAGITRFPHPLSTNKFLMCDLIGKFYIVYCPEGESFQPSCSRCVAHGQDGSYSCKTMVAGVDHCTKANILAGKLFWPHPSNTNKYIHCDIWGHPWEQDCPPGKIWDQLDLTCIVPTSVNPCKAHGILGQTLWPHCDPHKYIHCDGLGQSFVQSCQFDYVFYPAALTCVPPGSYPGTENIKNTCT